MPSNKVSICLLLLASLFCCPQQEDAFHAGTVIPKFGKVANVDSDMKLTSKTKLKICFDVAEKSRGRSINQSFDSAARFINLNVASGADPSNIEVAIVVHGAAAIDLTNATFYGDQNEKKTNPNVDVIAQLSKHNTTFYLCGQTAAWRGITKSDLLPGVKLAPSAMTAHVLLQQEGFALNPF